MGVLISKITFAPTNSYICVKGFTFYDAAGIKMPVTGAKVTASDDYRKCTFTLDGVAGTLTTGYTSKTTSAAYNAATLITGSTSQYVHMYSGSIVFASPVCISRINMKLASGSTSTARNVKITTQLYPVTFGTNVTTFAGAKVATSGTYSNHDLTWSIPKIKALKVWGTLPEEQRYYLRIGR